MYRVGVLLVNYRQWELTKKCIDSLLASKGVEVLIGLVDNNSPGDVPDWVGTTGEILFRRLDTNEGLTAGNNIAFDMISENGTDYVLVLNNDTEVAPDSLELLARHLACNPGTGIAAPSIPYADSPDRLWSAGGKFIRWRMILEQVYDTPADLPSHPVEMDQVTGCAMLMRTEDYRRLGGQDAELFVYFEDTDLCFRVKEAGLGIVLIPDAVVFHQVSISVGGVYSPFAIYFTHRNRYIVAQRYLKPCIFAIFAMYYVMVTLAKTIVYPLRRCGSLVPWMWLGFAHGIRRRTHERPSGLFRQEPR